MNCKPGDIAFIVPPAGWDQAVAGRVVEVLSANCDHEQYERVWNVRSTVPIETFNVENYESLGAKRDFQCPDSWLRPIGGVPVDEEITDDLEIPA